MHKLDTLFREQRIRQLDSTTRRHFIKECMFGLGGVALGGLLNSCANSSVNKINSAKNNIKSVMDQVPHFVPKAKSVIFLHMVGAPSQLEMFDYKPKLAELHNEPCPHSLLEGKKFAFIRGVPNMLGPQAKFSKEGASENWVSDNLPHFKKIIDEVAFLKAVKTDQFNHGPAQLLMHTGSPRLGRASLGSWVTYGLGSIEKNLPGFVVLTSGGTPDAGKSIWGSGFLPSIYQGVQCRSKGDPVLYLKDPKGFSRNLKNKMIESINSINQNEFLEYNDPEVLTRIKQYEMAFKMQVSVPEVMDINNEPNYIKEMYGVKVGRESFANNCLLARKMIEEGVRFVQLYDWGWDSHGDQQSNALNHGFRDKCNQIDRPISALIQDLKQRGLLDETLIVWGGEFGRTPMQETREGKINKYMGRDHQGDAFTMWMAGGGIKKGVVHGRTDEIGYAAVEGSVSVHDVQATILHLLGFDHEQLTYDYQGRPIRLTDVHGEVINAIVA